MSNATPLPMHRLGCQHLMGRGGRPARACALLPAIPRDCCRPWQGVFRQIPRLPAGFFPAGEKGVNFHTCMLPFATDSHLLTNSSTLNLCLSRTLTLGCDFQGAEYGTAYP